MGETTAGRVIFGDPGSEPILGVTALESVGIMVDPASKTLKETSGNPAEIAAGRPGGAFLWRGYVEFLLYLGGTRP
jgi:hypothetical protein